MTTIREAVEDLFNDGGLSIEEAIDRHYAPGFRQRTDGSWDDRAAVAARMGQLRERVARATITVLDELSDGPRYAERHIIDLALRDGEHIVREVLVFADRAADGRFARIEEATRPAS